VEAVIVVVVVVAVTKAMLVINVDVVVIVHDGMDGWGWNGWTLHKKYRYLSFGTQRQTQK
jgi:hypothetical protein